MEHIQQRSEPVWLPLTPRLICEKCVHKASVIFDRHPLCGDCFLVESTKPAAVRPQS